MRPAVLLLIFITSLVITTNLACGKGSAPPANPCNGITVSVSGTATAASSSSATNGSIAVTASGGSGFTYSINGGTFQSSATFNGLAPGSYSITAKSSDGCTGNTSVTVGVAPNPCAGVTVTVSGTPTNPTSTTSNNGSIAATASGSTGFIYSLNSGAFQASGTFNNLGVGSFTITARDANGCTGSASFTLTASNPCTGVTINVTGTTTNPTSSTSNNGSIVATATGITGFSYSLNSGAFQASGTFNNLGGGSYTVTAKDVNGCTGSANFTLTAPSPCAGVTINVSNNNTNNIACATAVATITVNATGGATPYTYSRNGTIFQSSNIFTGVPTGSYTITVRDANACVGTGSATVADAPAGPLFLAARTVILNNCGSCHNNTIQNGGMNWSVDCNIVQFKDRIRARGVDGVPSPMPPTGLISATDRQKIMDWINAGGRFSD